LDLLLPGRGTVLVYLIVLILIFGVLGVIIVSLFTTATTSSATPNDARRAEYIAESGIRYALSEIRNSKDLENSARLLNATTEFKLGKNGSFTAAVFSPGIKSPYPQTISGSGFTLKLNAPYGGKFPDDFAVHNAVNDLYIVDWRQFPGTKDRAKVTGSTDARGASEITLTLDTLGTPGGQFDAKLKETVCFALLTTDDQTNFPRGGSIYVNEKASEFFPATNGAIRIVTLSGGKQYDWFYESRQPPSGGKVKLTNVREMPGATWPSPPIDLKTDDYVILAPYNFRVFAIGKSEDTQVQIGNNKPFWALATPSEYTIYMRELLTDKSIVQVGDVIRTQEAGDKNIELGRGASGTEGFGDLWYSGDKPIGGDVNSCEEGRCLFDEGVRVFFTAGLSGDGEGFTFTLIAGSTTSVPKNTRNSAGGDFALSELLAYAGRGQKSDGTFLDGIGAGLLPPKLALEFDTRTNLDEPLQYCLDATTAKANSRNDPRPGGSAKDVLQYVFWGNDTLAIACRDNNPTYDDNRHDAEGDEASLNWTYDTGANILSSSVIGADGAIYMSANDSTLYAFNPDGTLKWTYPFLEPNPNIYAPGIDRSDGTLYIDISGFVLVAINPADGTKKWQASVGADINATPAVASDGSIYFGTDNGKLFKYDPDDRQNDLNFPTSNEWTFDTGSSEDVNTTPAFSPDGSVVYAVSNSGRLFAVNSATGAEVWHFDLGARSGEIHSSPTVNPNDGTIYVGSDDQKVYAINPNDRQNDLNFPTSNEWTFDTGGEVHSTASLDPSAGTIIYIGSNDGKLHAINPDGTPKTGNWPFSTGGNVVSSPVVGSDGTVFVGSEDSNIYAINPDGTKKWRVQTGAQVQASPAVGDKDVVYVGSNDGHLYAIATVAVPRNYRVSYPNSQKAYLTADDLDAGVQVEDSDNWMNGDITKGPWAIRVEIERFTNGNDEYEYRISTWMRQCQEADCSDIKGTLYQDTTVKYEYSPISALPFTQAIKLTPKEHAKFDRFLFGFTTATKAADTQLVNIRDFQMTFIRTGIDPVVNTDPDWIP
jgi:outer membrane protein assembly factor BamB